MQLYPYIPNRKVQIVHSMFCSYFVFRISNREEKCAGIFMRQGAIFLIFSGFKFGKNST